MIPLNKIPAQWIRKVATAVLVSVALPLLPAQVTSISSLDVHQMVQQVGAPQKNKSFAGGPITLAGKVYAEGIGTHAPSRLEIKLNGNGVRFTATLGIDDSVVGEPCGCNKGNEGLLPRVGGVTFKLLGDNKDVIWQSPVMSGGDEPQVVDVSIKGFQTLTMGHFEESRFVEIVKKTKKKSWYERYSLT